MNNHVTTHSSGREPLMSDSNLEESSLEAQWSLGKKQLRT